MAHGYGSFSWTVAEICAKEGFWPDIISSDLHKESVDGTAYNLLTVMTKMLHVGMPLIDVIKAVTITPAAVIGRSNVIGSLSSGYATDITVVRTEDVDIDLEDCNAQLRRIKQRFVPVAVWKDGVRFKTSHFLIRLDQGIWPLYKMNSLSKIKTDYFSTKQDPLAKSILFRENTRTDYLIRTYFRGI